MEANRRLVKDIEDTLETRADLSCEADALSFAAGKGVCGAAELKVAEANVLHELDAFADFFQDWVSDKMFGFGKLKVLVQYFKSLVDVE